MEAVRSVLGNFLSYDPRAQATVVFGDCTSSQESQCAHPANRKVFVRVSGRSVYQNPFHSIKGIYEVQTQNTEHF